MFPNGNDIMQHRWPTELCRRQAEQAHLVHTVLQSWLQLSSSAHSFIPSFHEYLLNIYTALGQQQEIR